MHNPGLFEHFFSALLKYLLDHEICLVIFQLRLTVMANSVECANINNYHVLSHQMTANSIDAAHAPCAQCYWFLLGVKGRASIDPWDSLTAPKRPAPDKSMTPQCTTYTLWLFTGHEAKASFITCLSGTAELSKIHIKASEENPLGSWNG